jgi:hypothetical protein
MSVLSTGTRFRRSIYLLTTGAGFEPGTRGKPLGQAKVAKLQIPVLVQQEVFRFEVPAAE